MNQGPDKWLNLLRWFCPDHLLEEIEGDLVQRFENDVKVYGARKANQRLLWNVIRFFRPGILFRNRVSFEIIALPMLRNHFKIAFRHLLKSKFYSVINITGLAVGITSFFLILQYVTFELSFDRFNKNHDRIFRATYEKGESEELKNSSAGTFFGVGNLLRDNFPEVEAVVRLYKWPANTGVGLMAGEKVFNERNYFFAESSFFKVFPSLLLQGDPASAMINPNSIVVSQRLALKMFGTEDALGKMVARLDVENSSLIVTGIMMDPPAQAHFEADAIIPYDKDWLPDEKGTWLLPNNLTYLLLKEDADPNLLQEKLNQSVQKLQKDNVEVKDSKTILQPLTAIHFSDYKSEEIESNANEQVVYGIGIAGLIILLIAWINYVNLEVSRFLSRTREISVRRIIGSSKFQLFTQFFVQYACLGSIATSLSVLAIISLRPYFTALTGAEFLPVADAVKWPTGLALFIFIVGSCLTGIYPAWFLVRMNPIASLKGKIANTGVKVVKRSLLTFQLVTSVVLLGFLFVVLGQLDFMRHASMGMTLDHVLTINNTLSYSYLEDTLKKEKSLAFRNKLLQNPLIRNVSTSSIVPGEPVGFTYHNLTKRSLDTPDDNVPYKVVFVDYYFAPVYNLPLLAGRNYSVDSGEDNNLNSLMINKAAVEALGFTSVEEALNKEIYFMVTFDWKKYRIIGILDDYRHDVLFSAFGWARGPQANT